MKKQFFTLILMLALVGTAGVVMAAAGDDYEPYVGQTKNYSIGGLTAGDSYEIWITTSTTAPVDNASAVALTIANMTAAVDNGSTPATGSLGTNAYSYGTLSTASTSVSFDVAWTTSAATTGNPDYYLWIKMETPGNCSNWRYKGINVYSYFVDFVIAAYQKDGTFTTAAGAAICQDPDSPNYNMDAVSPAVTTDGTLTHYYKITRTPNVTGIDHAWIVQVSINNDLTNEAIKWGTAIGSITTATAENTNISVSSGTDEIYISVTGDAYTTADLNATMTIAAQDDASHLDDDDADATIAAQNTATNSFKRLPSIGSFD